MALVLKKHQQIVSAKISELINDLGSNLFVHMRASKIDCGWCKFSSELGASSGQPEIGFDWTTHPNYNGSNRICPNCFGKGSIQTDDIITIDKVIESETKGLTVINGKAILLPDGSKKITGNLSDIDNNKVLSLADENYAIISQNSSGLNISTGDFMIEAWIKISASAGDRTIIHRMKKTSSGIDRQGYKLVINGNNISLVIGNPFITATTTTSQTDVTLTDGEYHHIAVVVDKSSTSTIYIDGSAVTTYSSRENQSSIGSIAQPIGEETPTFLGGQAVSSSFIGKLDEVRIWDFGEDSLPSDITTAINFHYNNAHSIYKGLDTKNNLKASWTFQENIGTYSSDIDDNLVTSWVNGTSFPYDTFASSSEDITSITKNVAPGIQGATSNGINNIISGNRYFAECDVTVVSGTAPKVFIANNQSGAGSSFTAATNLIPGHNEFIFDTFLAPQTPTTGYVQIQNNATAFDGSILNWKTVKVTGDNAPLIIKDNSGNQNNAHLIAGTILRETVGDVRGIIVDDTILFNSIKIVLHNIDYQLFNFKQLKLLDNFAFQAILKRAESSGVPNNAQ